jgi:hypothetical protein
LVNDDLVAALANSSNVHVFHLEGNPAVETWLDQLYGETPVNPKADHGRVRPGTDPADGCTPAQDRGVHGRRG